MRLAHHVVKADAGTAAGPEGQAVLFVIQKPRPTAAERGLAALSRAAHAVPAAVDAVVMGPFRAMENRRLLDTMAAMSDHDLRDIGLSRGDIRDVMAMPVGSDGSLFLAGRRDSRRGRH